MSQDFDKNSGFSRFFSQRYYNTHKRFKKYKEKAKTRNQKDISSQQDACPASSEVALQQSSGWNQQQDSKTKRKAFPAKVPSRKKRKQIGFSKSHMNNQGKVFPNLNKCGSGGKQNSANEVIVISSDSEETTLNSRQLSIQKNDFACTSMDLLDSDSDDDNGSSVHLPINLVKTVCNVGNSSCDNEKRHSLVTTVQETEEQPSTSESCSQADKNDRVQFLKCATIKRKSTSDNHGETQGKRKRLLEDGSDAPFTVTEARRLFEHDKVSQEMRLFVLKTQQKPEFLQTKIDLMKAMENAVAYAVVPGAVIHLVGSSINGFGRLNSDADMCLVLDPTQNTLKSRGLINQTLYKIKHLLQRAPFVKNMQVIPAKVPILRFSDKLSGMCCDLNVNNLTGIRNTYLLLAYARYDPRVRPLVLCVKEWAHQRDLNDASCGTLSSYALVLMVLYYLQCGTKPRVLPSLQLLHPDLFTKNLSIAALKEHVKRVCVKRSENRQTLSELLCGFFEHFAFNFQFDKEIMSVRAASKLSLSSFADKRSWQRVIKIEEPFDLTNVARACQDHKAYLIKEEFRKAFRILRNSNSLRALIRGAPSGSFDRYFNSAQVIDD